MSRGQPGKLRLLAAWAFDWLVLPVLEAFGWQPGQRRKKAGRDSKPGPGSR